MIDLGSSDSGKKANQIVYNLLYKRGFKPGANSWSDFQQKFDKGDWNIGITSNVYIRNKSGKKINLWDIPIKRTPQIVNHFYNINTITQKVNLTEFLEKYVSNHKLFYPQTFVLRSGDTKVENLISSISSKDLWIIKPSNLRCGQEIYLYHTLEEIVDFIDKNQDSEYVIQKYISNPLLYNGRKFDVRVHVLIDNNFNIYLNPTSFVRTTSRKYTPKLTGNWNIDKFIHLTNHSVQKYDTDFGKYEESNILLLEKVEIEGVNLFEKFMPIWRDIIKEILTSYKIFNSENRIKNKTLHYELLGFDFIIDEELNTWLLEININPMLNWEHKEADKKVIKMMDDVFKITIDPYFNKIKVKESKNQNSWVKI
jgi:hypothetical protein